MTCHAHTRGVIIPRYRTPNNPAVYLLVISKEVNSVPSTFSKVRRQGSKYPLNGALTKVPFERVLEVVCSW